MQESPRSGSRTVSRSVVQWWMSVSVPIVSNRIYMYVPNYMSLFVRYPVPWTSRGWQLPIWDSLDVLLVCGRLCSYRSINLFNTHLRTLLCAKQEAGCSRVCTWAPGYLAIVTFHSGFSGVTTLIWVLYVSTPWSIYIQVLSWLALIERECSSLCGDSTSLSEANLIIYSFSRFLRPSRSLPPLLAINLSGFWIGKELTPDFRTILLHGTTFFPAFQIKRNNCWMPVSLVCFMGVHIYICRGTGNVLCPSFHR